MARYKKIDIRMWNDAKFDKLSNEGKLIFIFLLTAPQGTMIGAVPVDKYTVCRYLSMTTKRYAKGFQELQELGMVDYDERGLFFIRNFFKYNPPENPNVVKSWSSLLDILPECELLKTIAKAAVTACETLGKQYIQALGEEFKKLAQYSIGNGSDNGITNGSDNGMPNGMPNQEQEQEQYINVATQHMSAEAKALSADLPPDAPQEETLTPSSDAEEELTTAQRAIRVGKHCPQQKIIDLYHECLPTLPRVRMWNTATRRQSMAARWREMSHQEQFQGEDEGLDFFRRFFEFVSHSPFLMGQIKGKDGRNFVADLEWLLNANNFTKICERRYHDR